MTDTAGPSERQYTKDELRDQGWKFKSDELQQQPAVKGVTHKAGSWINEDGGSAVNLAQEVCASGMLAADSVLSVMKEALDIAVVQVQGCRGMSVLGEKDETREQILAKGGLDAVLAALRAHPSEAEVQAAGCTAIGNFALGEGEATVRASGALAQVLEAMAALPAEAELQAKACRALGNCAFSPEGEADVLAKGGVAAVLAAMRAHPSDAAVQEEGCDALCNLPSAKAAILAGGGLAVVTASLSSAATATTSADECVAWLNEPDEAAA